MAYVLLLEFDVDLETHMRFGETIGEEPVQGLIVHTGGSSERGVYSLDVWETKEDADRFFAERLMPAMEKLGLPPGPPLSSQAFDMPYVLRG